MKRLFQDYVYLFTLAAVILLFDQWTKELVRRTLQVGEVWSPWEALTPYVRIVHWKNSGAAFGILQGFGGLFMVLAIVVALMIVFYFPKVPRRDWSLRLALGLQLGGAVGNLIDRLRHGYVTDFISVGTFPVFNIADSSISIGVAILALGLWLKDRQERKGSPQEGNKLRDSEELGQVSSEGQQGG
ncbi:MAG: signal peptidase II [Anaerolineales bacterium]|nr:signal peptidase II [Anaerolineales bacterium]MCS7247389.1 signal peptidase II [Anaerolineales bacterium]MDW8161200.1 signal peptidase II [Anaerolineales bacterium]MDW8448026.1 signal peptidase II [Anaerolineales bacterium]